MNYDGSTGFGSVTAPRWRFVAALLAASVAAVVMSVESGVPANPTTISTVAAVPETEQRSDKVDGEDTAGGSTEETPDGQVLGQHAPWGVQFMDDGVRVDRDTQIAATITPLVGVSTSIAVTGIVRVHTGAKAAPRPVRLSERLPDGTWQVLRTETSTPIGSFHLVIPAGHDASSRVFRVVAPTFGGLPATGTTLLRTLVVDTDAVAVPAARAEAPIPTAPALNWAQDKAADPNAPAPVGAPTDWSWLYHTAGARWDPCSVITWAYNPDQGYAKAVQDAKRAFAVIADRTGLRFRYVGTTDYTQFLDPPTSAPVNADITVGWGTSDRVPHLAGNVVGLGGGTAVPVTAPDVAYEVVQGYVVLDSDHVLRTGHDVAGLPTWGQVLTHEVLHVLGLGHADGAEEVMHEAASATNHHFGAGDVTGMSKISARNGCL